MRTPDDWREKIDAAQNARLAYLSELGGRELQKKKAIVGSVVFEDGTTAPLKRIPRGKP